MTHRIGMYISAVEGNKLHYNKFSRIKYVVVSNLKFITVCAKRSAKTKMTQNTRYELSLDFNNHT